MHIFPPIDVTNIRKYVLKVKFGYISSKIIPRFIDQYIHLSKFSIFATSVY